MKRPSKGRKRKARIMLKTGAKIVERGTTRNDSTSYPRIQGRPPASVSPVFRVKLRKKQ